MVKKLTEANFAEETANGKVVIDFSAEWCGPCKMLAPILEEVSEELTDISFFNVDIDESMRLAAEYRITSVPSLLLLEDGEKKNMLIGFSPKPALISEIKESF